MSKDDILKLKEYAAKVRDNETIMMGREAINYIILLCDESLKDKAEIERLNDQIDSIYEDLAGEDY